MKNLLLLTILLSTQCFAVEWECLQGTKDLYHNKEIKAYYSEDFVVCHKLEKSHATQKRKEEHRQKH